jgi:hypothetical protein
MRKLHVLAALSVREEPPWFPLHRRVKWEKGQKGQTHHRPGKTLTIPGG